MFFIYSPWSKGNTYRAEPVLAVLAFSYLFSGFLVSFRWRPTRISMVPLNLIYENKKTSMSITCF